MDPKEKMRAALKAARDIAAKAEQEGRDLSLEEVAQASTHLKSYQEAKDELARATSSQQVKDALDSIGLDLGLDRAEPPAPPTEFAGVKSGKSIGALFVESAEYKGLMAQFGSGRIGEKARVQSAPFGLKGLINGGSDISAGAFVQNDATGIYEPLGRRTLTIRDLVSRRTTSSDTVEYVRQTKQLSDAAVVAEATTAAAPTTGAAPGAPLTPAAGGGYKPEGALEFEKVTASVKTIAEWVPATKRGLADAAQLRGLIDDELRADLAEHEEDQILNGDGTDENFTGIMNTPGLQVQQFSNTVAGLNPLLETTLRAKTKVRSIGRATPSAYVFNPEDWEEIQLARLEKNPNNEANAGSTPTLHGLPVVESEAMAPGTGGVADWRKAVIWDRQQATITATDSHADFFIRNLVAVLGEERLAFGVTRPAAFVQIELK